MGGWGGRGRGNRQPPASMQTSEAEKALAHLEAVGVLLWAVVLAARDGEDVGLAGAGGGGGGGGGGGWGCGEETGVLKEEKLGRDEVFFSV